MPHITGKTSHHFKKGLNLSENALNKNRNLYKSLNFSENIFKMPRILKYRIAAMASPPLTVFQLKILVPNPFFFISIKERVTWFLRSVYG
jgi:hypothetical protein